MTHENVMLVQMEIKAQHKCAPSASVSAVTHYHFNYAVYLLREIISDWTV